jgi:alkaline phosphatase D
LLNLFSVLLNLVIFACVIDALWVPVLGMEESGLAFVRVGEVASGGIKISARVPPPVVLHTASAVNGTEEEVREDSEGEGARVAYRTTKPLGKWIMGPMIETSEEADWMATVSLDGLFASTHYECEFRSSLSELP